MLLFCVKAIVLTGTVSALCKAHGVDVFSEQVMYIVYVVHAV